jgi:hypothetical protein
MRLWPCVCVTAATLARDGAEVVVDDGLGGAGGTVVVAGVAFAGDAMVVVAAGGNGGRGELLVTVGRDCAPHAANSDAPTTASTSDPH